MLVFGSYLDAVNDLRDANLDGNGHFMMYDPIDWYWNLRTAGSSQDLLRASPIASILESHLPKEDAIDGHFHLTKSRQQ